jgi:transposase
MISLPSGTRIWLVAGATDMRKSFNGLGEQIHHVLDEDPSPAICLSSGTPWRYRENTLG